MEEQSEGSISTKIALDSVRTMLKSFEHLRVEECKLQRMSGTTNQTYVFHHSNKDIHPKCVIFRVFGKKCEETFIDRENETLVYNLLAQIGLGPQILGSNSHARVEEFFDSRVLQQVEMTETKTRRIIALALAKMHSIHDSLSDQDLPQITMMSRFFEKVSGIMDHVNQKLQLAKTSSEQQRHIDKTEEMIRVWKDRSEIESMVKLLPTRLEELKRQVKLCHNDLNASNILILSGGEQSIKFIDFEYAAWNFRAFDIANYFNETAYVASDVPPYFQGDDRTRISKEAQIDFVRYYVAGVKVLNKRLNEGELDVHRFVQDSVYFEEMIKIAKQDQQDFEEEVKIIVENELEIGECMSHLYWGVWALYMGNDNNTSIQFDYVEYAYSRFQKYLQVRDRIRLRRSNIQ